MCRVCCEFVDYLREMREKLGQALLLKVITGFKLKTNNKLLSQFVFQCDFGAKTFKLPIYPKLRIYILCSFNCF